VSERGDCVAGMLHSLARFDLSVYVHHSLRYGRFHSEVFRKFVTDFSQSKFLEWCFGLSPLP